MKTDSDWPQIVGIGATLFDTLMVVDTYPVEDTKLQVAETKMQGGGPCATALVASAKLGISAAYMGTVGDDYFGRFMLKDLDKWGVSTKYVRVVPNRVSFHSVVLLNRQSGTRTCLWNKGTIEEPQTSEILLDVLANAQVLHLDGNMLEAAIYAAKFCRQSGTKVSLDAGGTYPGIANLMSHVDYLMPSEEFALKMTGAKNATEAAKMLFDSYKPELLVVTQGDRGGMICDEKGLRRYVSFEVAVVDSNGSGDTFHGAFLAAKLKSMSNDSACGYASAAAAIKCTRLGPRIGVPSDTECRSFLHERGIDNLA